MVGFWTPEYLAEKRATVEQFRGEPLLLAIQKDSAKDFSSLGISTLPFDKALKIGPILEALKPLGQKQAASSPILQPLCFHAFFERQARVVAIRGRASLGMKAKKSAVRGFFCKFLGGRGG
ncbi:MAG: hypothetical protein ACFUZC_12125 [Chthoniobacteraceae bacterium]